jgi:type VI secretion system secreted protein Hcp
MAVDMFLKLETVNGESIDDSHKGEIDLLTWTFGATQTGTAQTGGGAGAGRAQVKDLSLTKRVDRSSPVLFSLCCKGEHVTKAQITVRKAGGSPLEYLKVHLEKVLISGYATLGNEDNDQIVETLTLNFAKAKLEYTPQKDDGSGAPSIIKGWDIGANKAWD